MRRASGYLVLPACVFVLTLCQSGCKPPTPDAPAARITHRRVAEPILGMVPDVVIPAGTQLRVRLDHDLSTSGNRPGDRFTGRLIGAVAAGKQTVLPAGTAIGGLVRQSAPSGQLESRAILAVAVDRLQLDGRTYGLTTGAIIRRSESVALTGAGTALTRRRQVGVPAESVLTFRLNQPLAVKRPA